MTEDHDVFEPIPSTHSSTIPGPTKKLIQFANDGIQHWEIQVLLESRGLTLGHLYSIYIIFFSVAQSRCYQEIVEGEVSSQLPKPDNVMVVSFNMGTILTWDIPEYSPSNLTYTAQMKGMEDFQTVCNHTGDRHCDMGPIPSCLGAFLLRVRAEAGTAKSRWVKVLHKPSEDTVIGAPTLQVEFKAEEVEVVMADPVLRVPTPLTECYSKVSYVLQYWRKDRPDHVLEKKGVADKRVRLRLNDPGNCYCIQARVDPYGRQGLFSEPVCDQSGRRASSVSQYVSRQVGCVVKVCSAFDP
ncbi:unnamed protein product [Arctogadus glacialis]